MLVEEMASAAMAAAVLHAHTVDVDGNTTTRHVELFVACAEAADGSNIGAVAVAQHLHVTIALFNKAGAGVCCCCCCLPPPLLLLLLLLLLQLLLLTAAVC